MRLIERRYGIAGKVAGEAALEFGRDGARIRSCQDAFVLSRIARAIVDALDADDAGAVEALTASREALYEDRDATPAVRRAFQIMQRYLADAGGQAAKDCAHHLTRALAENAGELERRWSKRDTLSIGGQ